MFWGHHSLGRNTNRNPYRRLIGGSPYWRRRRRQVIDDLKAKGVIAHLGPAGQILSQHYVGQKEAESWWRRAERPPRLWLLTLLLSGVFTIVILQLPAAERKPYFVVLVGPPLIHAGVGLLRHLRR